MIGKNRYPMNGVIEYDYNYHPKTTIIINYFTSVDTMIKTINNFRSLGDEVEIIVNNDNHGKDTEKIMKALTHRNDRMMIARDVGEKRGYDYGARLSISDEFLIFTQDDDLAPNNDQWYQDCLQEFERDSKLGIIGGLKGGWNYGGDDKTTMIGQQKKLYVSWLATGPLMIRKKLYFDIGGWSEEYSQVGEADGGADADLTTKVVLAGYKAMHLTTSTVKQWKRRFQRGDNRPERAGSVWGKNCQKRIQLNNQIYFNKHKDKLDFLFNAIKDHNKGIGIDI